MKLLLHAGADLSLKNGRSEIPLDLARQIKNREIVDSLEEAIAKRGRKNQ